MERQQAKNEPKKQMLPSVSSPAKVWSLECFPHRLYNVNIKVFMHYSIRCTLSMLPPPFVIDPSFETLVCDIH